jgi:hypothetical protein
LYINSSCCLESFSNISGSGLVFSTYKEVLELFRGGALLFGITKV